MESTGGGAVHNLDHYFNKKGEKIGNDHIKAVSLVLVHFSASW